MSALEVEVKVRPKNQLTIPEAIVKRLGIEPGDRLVFSVDEENPEQLRIRKLRRSYYGLLEGVYGKTPEEVAEYIRQERASWGE